MKIKRQPKRSPSTCLAIATFIAKLNTAHQDDIPELVQPVVQQGWSWPRTDLQHWIVPLNRFDTILETIIRDYDLATMEHCQTNSFTPRTSQLLHAILAFEKILLENSTNRKIYSSFDRLNDLLHTTDMSVLLATLRLSLRPAQQFSSTSSLTGQSPFAVAEKRLLNLAQGWGTREYGLEMVDLAGDSIDVPAGLDETEWQFYKTAATSPASGASTTAIPAKPTVPASELEKGEKGKESDAMEIEDERPPGPSVQSTPAPKPRATFASGSLLATPIPATPSSNHPTAPSEGLTTISLGNIRANPKSPVDILVDAIETYDIPEPDRLNLLQKIRIAKSLNSTQERRTMLVVRLLSIAVFAHTTFESSVQTKLFLYEPELISQLAELVHPDRNVPIEIQAAAFYALDSLAKFKSKLGEVASALNASVSHGILMYVIRRTVTDLSGDNAVSTPDFIDSLFNILNYFQTSAFVGNMIVGAGIVTLLVDFVKIQRRDRIAVVTRAITFLDSLMYGYSSAFNLFISIGGLPVFVERVKDEIEICVEAHSSVASTPDAVVDAPTGLLSFDQAALLKSLLRALQRLMQTAGTTEGLRNLIDTTLLASVKSVIQHRVIFGPQLLGLAINICATFVHNEPTCLATIQEAQIPETLYDAIEDSIPPSIDVLQAIPNAIGALCLNPAGLAQFNTRPVIEKYFAIFASDRHVKILVERDNANMIGSAIDELIRHHPTLKDKVLVSVIDALKAIREKGRNFVPESSEGYSLHVDVDPAAVEKVDSTAASISGVEQAGDATTADSSLPKFDEIKDNIVLTSTDVIGRFLEGLFQNLSHCKDFVKLDPIPILLDIFSLPCAPSLTLHHPAFNATSGLFRLMIEVKANEVVTEVLKQVKVYLDETKPLWSGRAKETRVASLLAPTSQTLADSNKQFRSLSNLLTSLAFLADIYTNLTYSHGKVATTLLSALASPAEAQTLIDIGEVYRFCLTETILIKKSSAPTPVAAPTIPDVTMSDGTAVITAPAAVTEVAVIPPTSTPPTSQTSNQKAVLDIISQIPTNIVPLLQAAIKLFVHRRSYDTAHRKASAAVAKSVAYIMTENLRWPDSPELDDSLAYSTLMFSSTSSLLFDERSSAGLQTLLLLAFEEAGGIKAFLELFARYETLATQLLEESSINSNSNVGLPVVHVFGGLKIALDLLLKLSNHRTILEAPQTGLLLSRDKDNKTGTDHFAPHELLVRLRAAILPAIKTTWDIPWLRKSPPNVVRNIVVTLVNILRADGEVATEPPAGRDDLGLPSALLPRALAGSIGLGGLGALGGLGGLGGSGAPAPAAPGVVDEARISQLMDMGFPRAAARTALVRCRNSVPVATEYLLQHPDIVGAARAAEEAAALAAPADDAPAPDATAVLAPVDASNEQPAVAPPAEEPALVPAPEPVIPATQEDVEMSEPAETVALKDATPTTDVEMSPTKEEKLAAESLREKAAKETKATLDAARLELKPTFLPRALLLAEDYSDLVFEIKNAYGLLYPSPTGESSALTLKPLLDDFAACTKAGEEASEQAIATRFRVLALACTDAVFKEAVEESRQDLMAIVAEYQQKYLALGPAKDARPKWLAGVMLVAESLFSYSEVPAPIAILPEGEEVPSIDLVGQGPAWLEERKGFFDVAMDLLIKGVSDRGIFISTLRLLLILTRDHAFAVSFIERDGLRQLFNSLHSFDSETEGCHSYAVMIVRHVVEEASILRPIMEREIEAWFSQSRAKVADVTAFLRGVSSIAFRNTPTFLEATKVTCKLVQADATGHYHIGLVNEPQPTSKQTEADSTIRSPFAGEDATADTTMVAEDTPLAKPTKELPSVSLSVESTVHFLMTEIMESSKLALAAPSPPKTETGGEAIVSDVPDVATSADPTAPTPAASSKEDDKPSPDHFHTSFALSTLSELLSSYSVCKTSFLTFSTRRPKESTAASSHTTPKSRASFLHFLLNDLIPVGTVVPANDHDSRRRATLSMWASLVIISLCCDPDATTSSKESAHDITHIRKGVLDAIARAFKDATSSTEATDVRYGRLFSLSDLCYRLLTSRAYPGAAKPRDDTSMQLAKLMLEKNFAVILTNALADVDLNFPSVSNLINGILRPLEQLTKVVTKVGRAKNSAPLAGNLEDEDTSDGSSLDEDVEIESDEEPEAPDLYRNSALGMYEGELEPGHEAYMSGSSGDEYDEDDEMMDEMDDGVIPGSDVSDVSDDDGDDDGGFSDAEMAAMIGDDGETSDDDGSSQGDDDVELAVDDEDGPLDLDEGDESQDDEGWAEDEVDLGDDQMGEEQVDGFEHLVREGDDADSEDSESYGDLEEGIFPGELEFDEEMTEQLMGGRTGSGAFGWDSLGTGESSAGRRNRALADDMMLGGDPSIFGRPRSSGLPSGSGHGPAHPLLTDAPANDSQQNAPSRRQRRGPNQETPEYSAWVQSIEQMVGAGAVEALQDLLGRNGLGHLSGPDQIRLQVAPGPDGGLALVIDPNPNGVAAQAVTAAAVGGRHHRIAPHSHRRTSSSSDRYSTQSLIPTVTPARWGEEARVATGILPAERIARLTNYVINVLHPAARLVARQAKEAENARREEQKKAVHEAAQREAGRLKTEAMAKLAAEKALEEAGQTPAREPENADARRMADRFLAEAQANLAASSSRAPSRVPSRAPAPAPEPMADGVAEVMDLARSLAAGLGAALPSSTPPVATPAPEASEALPEEMDEDSEDDDDDEDEEGDDAPEASGSGQERVIVTIHGEEIDITDTGIDPTFLEALPDDMREEVLNQHFRESRATGPPAAVPSSINSEFLDALPPDLRAEVLRQEAAEQRREQATARAATRTAALEVEAAGPAEIDPATFLASLDPQLRQAVLLEQEDGFLSTLPANLIAEANILREQSNRNHAARVAAAGQQPPAGGRAPAPVTTKKPAVQREAIQLLDKSGLATLVRLLFFPQPLKKNSLQKVLVNLCENTRTRTELINLLLTILQDGTRDVSAVDKSFSQMSLRASKAIGPKDTPRRKAAQLETPGGGLPHFPGESVPNLIAHRCLEALLFLVSSNDQSPLFFLTEQEVRSSRKGKGKEKALPLTTFPIIVLLGLLSRPALLKTQSMMDAITQLLATITKALSALQNKEKAAAADESKAPTAAAPSVETLVAQPQPTESAAPVTEASTASTDATPSAQPDGVAAPRPSEPTELSKEPVKEPNLTDILIKSPPQIPAAVLRLVVNILDAGECSSKTFQQTLLLIQNLSYLPEARDVIAEELKTRSQSLAALLAADLDELVDAIAHGRDVRTVTLAKFSPASSLQAKLLRILKVLENSEKRSTVYEELDFGQLWSKLSSCLDEISERPELQSTAGILLPLIESLLVVFGAAFPDGLEGVAST
ncbi:hypothetical protein P7C70_g1715, partial [Phenoliferia sp. Uapishka_3]